MLSNWLLTGCLTFALTGQALAQTATTPGQTGGQPPAFAASSARVGAPDPTAGDYRLGSGDKLRIIVFGEDTLSGEFFVSSAGKIEFPLIGGLDAGGLTARELQTLIASKLSAGYLKDPRVSAEVLSYRPFYILGEVNKPGEYPFTSGLTVQKAVATAQGFTYRANQKRAFIKRADDTVEHPYKLDSTTPVQPGDTVRIIERYF